MPLYASLHHAELLAFGCYTRQPPLGGSQKQPRHNPCHDCSRLHFWLTEEMLFLLLLLVVAPLTIQLKLDSSHITSHHITGEDHPVGDHARVPHRAGGRGAPPRFRGPDAGAQGPVHRPVHQEEHDLVLIPRKMLSADAAIHHLLFCCYSHRIRYTKRNSTSC